MPETITPFANEFLVGFRLTPFLLLETRAAHFAIMTAGVIFTVAD